MSSSIRTVAVHGATGQQGGGAARALSAAGFTVKALVRDESTTNAVALKTIPGVEVVVVDIDDANSVTQAYTGVDAVFACTAYLMDEIAQGKRMADAAKATGVKHFIWSGLVSISQISGGRLTHAQHFDDKVIVSDYIRGVGIPATILNLGAFSENYLNYPGQSLYEKDKDLVTLRYGGMYADVALPMLRARVDVGNAVKVILEHTEEFVGKTVHLGDILLTTEEQAKIVQSVTGHPTHAGNLRDAKDNSFASMPQNILDMYTFFNEYELGGLAGLVPDPLLKKHGFKAASFESFVSEDLAPHLGL